MVYLGQSLLRVQAFLFLLILLAPPFCSSAESPPALTVTAMGAHLYARQDKESEMITNLEKGEELLPVGQAIGTGLWYYGQDSEGGNRLGAICRCEWCQLTARSDDNYSRKPTSPSKSL